LFSQPLHQQHISAGNSKRPLSVNFLISSHSLHQRVNTDESGIGSMKASYVTQCPFLTFLLPGIGAAAREEIEKGLVQGTVIQFFQNFVYFREEVALT